MGFVVKARWKFLLCLAGFFVVSSVSAHAQEDGGLVASGKYMFIDECHVFFVGTDHFAPDTDSSFKFCLGKWEFFFFPFLVYPFKQLDILSNYSVISQHKSP